MNTFNKIQMNKKEDFFWELEILKMCRWYVVMYYQQLR